MWPYHPDLLDRPVPRYTSFPTAAQFQELAQFNSWSPLLEAALQRTTAPASLYVHIPYCSAICWYCGCNTGAAGRTARLTSYLDALHAEIATVAARLGRSATISHIALGGGSPNAIAPVDFVRLLDRLMTAFSCIDPSVSVELDPRGLNGEWTSALGVMGVRRVSMGVQTLAPHVQAAIGRIQPADLIARSTEDLRATGVDSINFDLMYGLPEQSMADLDSTISDAIAMAPDRIALFGYAHVPHIIPRQRQIEASHLPDAATRFAMAANGHDQLTAAGYVPVGFDHFARPDDPLALAATSGRLRRNFQGFTDDDATCLIGVGASAISQFDHLIVQNEKNAGRYRMRASQGLLTAAQGLERSADDRARGAIIAAILCHQQVDAGAYPEQLARLTPFVDRGLVDITDMVITPVDAGRPYARSIAACFDPYLDAAARRFSSAV